MYPWGKDQGEILKGKKSQEQFELYIDRPSFGATFQYDIYLKSNGDYSVRKLSNIFKKGHFSSFFVLPFSGLKTRELGCSASYRASDSLQNPIYGYVQKFNFSESFFSAQMRSRIPRT
jgi:hypothetical protein